MRGTWLITCCFALVACDKGDDTKKRDDLEAAGAAMLGGGKDDKTKAIEEKAAEERRKAFEEKKAKEAAETAKLDAIVSRVVKAGDKPSKDLETACTALITIYEDWVKAIYFDDDGFQLDFFDHKKKNLGVVKAKCAKLQSIPATDCMIEVIKGVSAEDFSEDDAKVVQGRPEYLFDACAKQFAPEKMQ
ncbi:hypothetical protein ENSA5_19940 [Enhygromyxa salina]|uniref:Lipoprotein n=1 Tax=Enhygromyxa salina TaxID=215803 RepID=A0A2S9YCR2_9BACT|nr:hypothetical protein [Enhygromyxa salina]PRQ02904.1 hypothetical protein ENSA5_19940 [Enhygromyxa salina]